MGQSAEVTGAYADVNGVRMYYEHGGTGEPVLVLHGGFGGAHMFGAQVPQFAERHRVFVPEQRGRGRTADIDGPITYPLMADDIVAFIEQTVGEPAHLAGDDDVIDHAHTVALYEALPRGQLAIVPGTSHGVFLEKPDLVNRIVLDFLAEVEEPQTLLPVRRATG